MSEARAVILGRIRTALSDVPTDEPPRWEGPGAAGTADAYRRGPAPGGTGVLDLFAERVADYRAEVVRCASDDAVARARDAAR